MDLALVVAVVAQSWLVAQSLDLLCAKVSLGTTLNLKSLPVADHLPQADPLALLCVNKSGPSCLAKDSFKY